ncbi:MAG: tRNA pseudouridine(55) synthase TruB [Mogibacterium sp.]|nr:tRNA pseudouridine(55) synthase TruB [Mogibacterium sp.]
MIFKDGVINIDKPEGWTSQDICAKLRHRLHIKKIGHTGTLDPMATGVLPVCIGKATRIIEYYDNDRKSYHAGMKLGITTDTLDVTGEVTGTYDFAGVTEESVRKAFSEYTGVVSQIPPKYSALKVNGRRAYDLAREGRDFELKSREITIFSNDITSLDIACGTIEFDVVCSKGTYIRTICDDIGRALGCGAVMTSLRRTGSGFFRAEESVDISRIIEMTDEEISDLIIPMDQTLTSLGRVSLDDNRVTAFINGNPSNTGYRISGDGDSYLVYAGSEFLGIGIIERGALIPHKVITR